MDPSPKLMRLRRKWKKLTIKEAAEKANTAPARISDWEQGKHKPTPRSQAKLAKAYECDVDAFYEVDIPTIKTLGTAVIEDYFNDPEYKKDRKASIAVHLIAVLPDESEIADTIETKDVADILDLDNLVQNDIETEDDLVEQRNEGVADDADTDSE